MLIGCSFMWFASNIFWLLGSRLVVGFGHTFCLNQLKYYISEICDENLKIIMMRQITLHAFFGIVVIVSCGSFLNFETTAMVLTIISAMIFLFLLFLPQVTSPLPKTKTNQTSITWRNFKKVPLFQVLADKDLRKKFFIFFILVWCQQYSGIPATIVYSQIIFEKFFSPYPKFFVISYVVIYFLFNILGIFIIPKYNKRLVLLISSSGVSFVILIEVVISFLNINQFYWTYISLVVIYLYLILHTLGLGNIPFSLISDLFPNQFRNSITLFYLMFHSILALTITKSFQVIISNYHIKYAFCLFLFFSMIAFVFSYIYLDNSTVKTNNVNGAIRSKK